MEKDPSRTDNISPSQTN